MAGVAVRVGDGWGEGVPGAGKDGRSTTDVKASVVRGVQVDILHTSTETVVGPSIVCPGRGVRTDGMWALEKGSPRVPRSSSRPTVHRSLGTTTGDSVGQWVGLDPLFHCVDPGLGPLCRDVKGCDSRGVLCQDYPCPTVSRVRPQVSVVTRPGSKEGLDLGRDVEDKRSRPGRSVSGENTTFGSRQWTLGRSLGGGGRCQLPTRKGRFGPEGFWGDGASTSAETRVESVLRSPG